MLPILEDVIPFADVGNPVLAQVGADACRRPTAASGRCCRRCSCLRATFSPHVPPTQHAAAPASLPQVSFLAAMVGPKIASAAAQRALEVLAEEDGAAAAAVAAEAEGGGDGQRGGGDVAMGDAAGPKNGENGPADGVSAGTGGCLLVPPRVLIRAFI